MRELFIGRKEAEGEEGAIHRFDYYILIDQTRINGELFCESYGIKILSPDTREVAEIPNITVSISCIDDLAERMLRNCVTPSTAMDVVQDWL